MFFDNLIDKAKGNASFELLFLEDINLLSKEKKVRTICKPNNVLRVIHKALIEYLREIKPNLPYATGGRPKDSLLKNVKRHTANRFFYLIDLRKFYPNIRVEQLTFVLCLIDSKLNGCEEQVKTFLSKFCFIPGGGGLLIGAPASPDLSNILAGVLLDEPLGKLCQKYNISYTRYFDDLTFSSNYPIGKRKRRAIREIIKQAGFIINYRKSKVLDLKKKPIIINGVGLKFGGVTFLPRHFLKKIKGMIYLAKKGKIQPEKIHGLMGVFFSTINRKKHIFNKVEVKLLCEHKKFCRLIYKS